MPVDLHRFSHFAYVVTALLLVTDGFSVARSAERPAYDTTRFEVTTLASGLKRPMELAVAPDGGVFWIELAGQLKHWAPTTGQVTTVGNLCVTTEQENGLIGLALDPHFATNPWVYLQYSPPDFSGQYISRFRYENGSLDLQSECRLLQYEEQRRECCHHAGSMEFGPDGCLYIGTGDNTHPFGDSQGFAPLDERPDRAPYDAQKSSANTRSFNGKILRIRPTDDGRYSIPPGNLFPADGAEGLPEIFVMGCRNPWRLSVDPSTGFVYWGDVGPDAGADGARGPRGYDEINQARRAGNFGWPYVIADNQPYRDVDFATGELGSWFDVTGPANDSPNNTGAKRLPPTQPAMIAYAYGESATFPQLGSGGRTACAGPIYYFNEQRTSATQFPRAFDRTLFIFDWSRNWIQAVHLDDANDIAAIEPFLPDTRFIRPIDLEFGPEGAMYLLEYGDTWGVNDNARLVRIDYRSGNRTPIARANAVPDVGVSPLSVQLDGAGSYDKDAGEPLQFEWRRWRVSDPAGPTELIATTADPTVTFPEDGVYQVELRVTDAQGASSTAALTILVGNAAPDLRFLEPSPDRFFDPTQALFYELHVSDLEDGTSDAAEAESTGRRDLDSLAVPRTTVNARYVAGPLASSDDPADAGPPGLRRMKHSDCFNCHAVEQSRVGPPLLEIANKYRGQSEAMEKSIERVVQGSTGVWGKVPMIPHRQHTVAEVREMVSWIYALTPDAAVQVHQGLVGRVSSDAPSRAAGYYQLTASYTDQGAAEIPPITRSVSIVVRGPRLEAEFAEQINGPQVFPSATAHQGYFVGGISDGHSLQFKQVPLTGTRRVSLRVASAGAGGNIELRRDALDGPLLGLVTVAANGDWEAWHDVTCELSPSDGLHDLYVVFSHPQAAGGLLNLDAIDCHAR